MTASYGLRWFEAEPSGDGNAPGAVVAESHKSNNRTPTQGATVRRLDDDSLPAVNQFQELDRPSATAYDRCRDRLTCQPNARGEGSLHSIAGESGLRRLHSTFDPLERVVERKFDATQQLCDLGLSDDERRA
jgi:hypothetical protein